MTTTDDTLGLAEGFRGEILRPDDAAYDAARAIHNGLIDKRPALIARCANTADVVDAVNAARDAGLEISVRGGGHNIAGKAVTEGGLMIDLSRMKDIRVDPARRTVRVQDPGGVKRISRNPGTCRSRAMPPSPTNPIPMRSVMRCSFRRSGPV